MHQNPITSLNQQTYSSESGVDPQPHPQSSLGQSHPQGGYVFVFISVFSQEGGIQSYIQDILRGYADLNLGIRTDLLLLRDRPQDSSVFFATAPDLHNTLRIYSCKSSTSILERLRLVWHLLWLCLRHRPRHLFCGHVNLLPVVHPLCRGLGLPYTVLTYGKEVWEPLSPWQQYALRQADRIWTISRYSRDRSCHANQLDPQRLRLLPCVVDGGRFTPGPKPLSLLQQYDLTGAKVLLTVARLWPGDVYKGVDVTIRALPQILEHEPTVKYLVIGRGEDQRRLAQLAAQLRVGDRVLFAGFVPIAQLVDYYRLADAYVMPSQEGFGIVYLEAMACGIPVLAGDGDGSGDPLQDGRLGWRVPHRNPEAVAQACVEILAGQDQRCDGNWLRQQVLREFERSAMANRLRSLLADCPTKR